MANKPPAPPADAGRDRLRQGMAAALASHNDSAKKAVDPVADQEVGTQSKANKSGKPRTAKPKASMDTRQTINKKALDKALGAAAEKANKIAIKTGQGRETPQPSPAPQAAPSPNNAYAVAPPGSAKPGKFGGNLDTPAYERKKAANAPENPAAPIPRREPTPPGASKAAPPGGFAGNKDRPAIERQAGVGTDFTPKPKHTIHAPDTPKAHRQMMKATAGRTVQGRLKNQKTARVRNSVTGRERGEGNFVDHIKSMYHRFSKHVKGTY